ncbi:MipA/OmpV family protein [Thalassotalea piscium]
MTKAGGLFLFLYSICTQAYAEDDYFLQLGVGAFALSIPDYPGSNEQTEYLVPLPYIYYQDKKISIDRQGITSSLWQKGRFDFDISAAAGVPVKSEKNRARIGMPDIDWTFELGLSAKYFWKGTQRSKNHLFSELFIRKVTATDFATLDGVGWHSGLATVVERTSTFFKYPTKWSTRFNINFNSGRYLDYYYGVEKQYQTAQRNKFQNNAGFAGVDLSSGVMMKLPSFWLGGFIKYYSFKQSEQINSPLLTDDDGWAVGVGLLWVFYNNKESL